MVMKEAFIKKYWDEEDVLYYLHFIGQDAVRQIEISQGKRTLLSLDNPEAFLYDQDLDDLELTEADFITEAEFNAVWNEAD